MLLNSQNDPIKTKKKKKKKKKTKKKLKKEVAELTTPFWPIGSGRTTP